jgi:hypothetical protein
LVKELRLAGVRALAEGNASRRDYPRLQRALCQSAGEQEGSASALRADDDLEDAFAWRRSAPSHGR